MTNKAQFQGKYVHDVTHLLIASAVSRQNAVMVSEPGWGKTVLARALGDQIAGDDTIFIRLEGSTPPEAVKGMYDPAAALDDPPKLINVIDGTPFDPNAFIVIADEIFRPNEVVFDLMLEVLDRQSTNPDEAPVVWGTSNFVAEGERISAVLDRIALWMWIEPEHIDVESFVQSISQREIGKRLEVPENSMPIPSKSEIMEVRSYKPSDDTASVVANMLKILADEAKKEDFKINPRRVTQWFEIVYRTAAFLHGSADFDIVPPEASLTLRWAYPALTPEEWAKWSKVASAVADPVGASIDAVLREAFEAFDEIEDDYESRSERSLALGEILSRSQRSLKALGTSDPRIKDAMQSLSTRFSEIVYNE